MTREGTFVFGFKSKLDNSSVPFNNYVLHEMAIPGKGGDKGPNELLANGRMPLHQAARNLNRHILRVVRHDAVLVGSAPRGVILDHERFDIIAGSKCSNARHRKPSIEALRPRPGALDYHATSGDAVPKKTDLCGTSDYNCSLSRIRATPSRVFCPKTTYRYFCFGRLECPLSASIVSLSPRATKLRRG